MSVAFPIIAKGGNIRWLKEKLFSYNYKMSSIFSRIGIKGFRKWDLDSKKMGLKIHRFLSRDMTDELDILIRTFTLNIPIDVKIIGKIFSDKELDILADINLISQTDKNIVYCDILLSECDDLIIAADSFFKKSPGINPVMPIMPECYDFSSGRSRRKVGKTLDLGTGSGVHALLASRHSEQVIGVDINPRAIEFSKFNSALNDIHNVNFIEGDLFAPVGDDQFELILADPPYLPVSDSLPGENFYSGGTKGDAISSRIIQGIHKYLCKNGLCQIIHMIICRGGEKYEMKLRSLLGDISNQYSFIVLSNPIEFRNEHTSDASSVEFGMTNIKRNEDQNMSFFCQAPFISPLPFDINDLFTAQSRVSTEEERKNLTRSFYESKKKGHPLECIGNSTNC